MRTVTNYLPASAIHPPVTRLAPLNRMPVLVTLSWSDGTTETDVPATCHAWTSVAVLVRHASPASEHRNCMTWLPAAAVRRVTPPMQEGPPPAG